MIVKKLHEERKFNTFPKGYSSKQEKEAKQNYESRKHCGKCGKFNKKFNCPVYNKICNFCKYKNYFAEMCLNKIIHVLEQNSFLKRNIKHVQIIIILF